MIPFVYTATAGLVAGLGAIGSKLIMRPANELQNDINHVKNKEQLEVNVEVKNSYTETGSFARFSSGFNSSKAEITMTPYSTNLLKVYAPIEFMKTDGKLYDNFILYHELSHTELNNMIKQRQMPFKPQFDSNENENSKAEIGVSNLMNSELYNAGSKNNFFRGNFHEQFADAYGAILIIRNKSNEFSDDEIKQAIKARYHSVKAQEEILWGASGDLNHRTENGLEKVLSLDFDKIRNLSPSESKELSLKIASNSTIEKFQEAYKTKFSPYIQQLDEESAKTIKAMQPDNSFLKNYVKNDNTSTLNLDINIDKINSLEQKFSQSESPSFMSKIDNFLNNFKDESPQNIESKKFKPS